MLQRAEQSAGDFVAGVRPDIDHLVVTLAIGDNTSAILLLHLPNLLVGIFKLCLLLFRNDHV